jgi:AraC-like DNA-binding protein
VITFRAMLSSAFLPPDPRLAEVVETVWAVDFTDPDATAMTIAVLPTTAPVLAVHYRAGMRSGAGAYDAVVAGLRSRPALLQPGGALGAVLLRLRPEAAPRLVGEAAARADGTLDLGAVIGAAALARLQERLAAADDAQARVQLVQDELAAQVSPAAADALAAAAVSALRRRPALPLRRLADRLGTSERHLHRRVTALTGVSPKRFARIARLEQVVAARLRGEPWDAIAHDAGFADQAHLVNDFRGQVGRPPAAFFGMLQASARADLNAMLATSDFCNTFVV